MSSSNPGTGYGPSPNLRLFFDGNEEHYELWEVKFLAHLRLQKLHGVIESTPTDDNEERNAQVFAELVQKLDDKSLSLIIRDAKDDGRKALKILREHYRGTSKPRIISLYTQLTTLIMQDGESVTSYVIRGETAATALKNAGETVSDSLLIAMIVKGLPNSFAAFITVITQREKNLNFTEFKSALRAYEETEKSRRKDDQVFKFSDKNMKCFNCGQSGHKKFQCKNKSNYNNDNQNDSDNRNRRYCTVCKTNTHDTKYCRKNKNKSSVNSAFERRDKSDGVGDYAGEQHHGGGRSGQNGGGPGYSERCSNTNSYSGEIHEDNSFLMKFQCGNTINSISDTGKCKILVDTGASSHIITNVDKFINIDKTFNPSTHFIELADGSRNNNMVTARGNAKVTMTDTFGKEHSVILKDALCIPSFNQDILSVRSATEQGVTVYFEPKCAYLKTQNNTIFDIDKVENLYYVNNVSDNVTSKRSLKEWHVVMGHCNKEDVLKLPNVVNGINITDSDKFTCETCIKGKFAQYRNRYPDLKAKHVLDVVHCDIAGPIDSVALNNFRYVINFVDDKSGYIFDYCIKNKSDAKYALKQFLADSSSYGVVKCLRSDNALECKCNDFESLLLENRVKHEFSSPRSPHQNGTAERSWRSLMEMTRCLLIESKLPKTLWSYAFKTSVYIRNRCYNNRTKTTPFQMMTSKTPNLSNMYPFGTKCFAYVHGARKLDDRAIEGLFLGYDTSSPAYIIYYPETGKISKVRMAKFIDRVTDELVIQQHPDEEFSVYNNYIEQPETTTKQCETTNETDQRQEDRRYPRRERHMPKYLEDYVNSSVDYCYRLTEIPNNFNEAIHSRDANSWKIAMKEELDSLRENNTYELTTLPEDRKAIKSRWVFAVKLGPDDEERFKARLVAKGYSQVPGVDYRETFSPTAKITSVRAILQVAIQHNYKINQMDVKSAYLNANIDKELYIEQPEGYEEIDRDGNKLVWKLNKSLYGLKQSGRIWNEMLHSFLEAEGFTQSLSDSCVYTKFDNCKILMLIVWVDDLLIVSNDDDSLNNFKLSLSNKFNMKDMGKLSWFLGIKFDINDNEIKMSQSKNITKMLDRFGLNEGHPKPIPADVTINQNDLNSKPADKQLYQEIVGSLIYVMSCTRPDICFSVSKLAQHMQNPTNAHLSMAKQVLRYLKGTINHALTFKKADKLELIAYSDSDWANDTEDRKSMSGYCFKLCIDGPLISWRAKKQSVVALSSCEAEYIAMTEAVKEAKFLTMLLNDISINFSDPVVLNVDNQGAIALANNPFTTNAASM